MEVFAVLLNATASKSPWFRTAGQHIADGLALWSVVGQIWATWYLPGNLALTSLLIDASRLLLIWAALSAHPRTSRNMYGQSLAVALAARLACSSCLFLLAVALVARLARSSLRLPWQLALPAPPCPLLLAVALSAPPLPPPP